ncbi:MAG: hypothetical protein ACD_35C00293G0001 [uncultured bacterium]|nr:MAG: hypothetical protein ACD_35C00293G0001 [uncultured bacterium]
MTNVLWMVVPSSQAGNIHTSLMESSEVRFCSSTRATRDDKKRRDKNPRKAAIYAKVHKMRQTRRFPINLVERGLTTAARVSEIKT